MGQLVSTLCYRVGQFLRALIARAPEEEEIEQAICLLTPEARALFCRQAVQDQRHGLAVYHTLRQAGHTDAQLLAAALLHDVGKAAAQLPPWQRAIIVLLNRLAPRLLLCLGREESQGCVLSGSTERSTERSRRRLAKVLPQSWRRPFIVHVHHPEVGARWAQEAGCSPLTVALIRRHQDRISNCQTEEDQLLVTLQAADNQS
jgi:hypothetical protein